MKPLSSTPMLRVFLLLSISVSTGSTPVPSVLPCAQHTLQATVFAAVYATEEVRPSPTTFVEVTGDVFPSVSMASREASESATPDASSELSTPEATTTMDIEATSATSASTSSRPTHLGLPERDHDHKCHPASDGHKHHKLV